jgi:GBF-interacting family protein
MGTGRGNHTNGNEGVNQVPTSLKKMIQNLKEIVNCFESEIYATLKECNMDPNEVVSRLLSQCI